MMWTRVRRATRCGVHNHSPGLDSLNRRAVSAGILQSYVWGPYVCERGCIPLPTIG